MSDPLAEEGYRLLAASVAPQPSATQTLPAQPVMAEEVPAHLGGSAEGSPISQPVQVIEPAARGERVRQHRPSFTLHRPDQPGSSHHTVLPRTMVVAGLLAALGSPLFFGLLYQQSHFDIVDNDWYFDERGRSMAVAAVAAVAACTGLGWLWWTIAASLNARQRARYAVAPWVAPLAAVLIVGCLALLPSAIESFRDNTEDTRLVALCAALIALPIVAFFSTLGAYRRAANSIGASQTAWNVIIVLPWAMAAANLLSRFFTLAAGDSYLTILGVVNMAALGVMVLSLYQAMASFDRACAGRQMAASDRGALPDFFRRG